MNLASLRFFFFTLSLVSHAAIGHSAMDIDPIANNASPTEPAAVEFKRQEATPLFTLFSPQNGEDSERLWSQTKVVFGLGLAVFGSIYLMPEEDTGWDRDEISVGNLFKNWKKNVTTRPVWDDDSLAFNYIAHPYAGGVYYQVARNSGYGQFDSFAYTALMSTFYWEYGIEAIAQPASIQDLIVTPLGGWIYGEWAFNKQRQIRNNGGEVWGSTAWGAFALFILDPVDNVSVGINKLFGKNIIKTGSVRISRYPLYAPPALANEFDGYIGLDIELVFY
jgi:hypothetical protein